MSTSTLQDQSQLGMYSRLAPIRSSAWSLTPAILHLTEVLILLGCGFLATFAVLALEFKLRLPGHSILRVVFPMAFGLALVPRVGAGTTMGIGAVSGAIFAYGLHLTERGYGSLTSLVLTGPLLDIALRHAKSGMQIYVRLIMAGMMSNTLALLVQLVAKLMRLEGGGGRSVTAWLSLAGVTYPIFGIVAGLISACVWFKLRNDSIPATSNSAFGARDVDTMSQ